MLRGLFRIVLAVLIAGAQAKTYSSGMNEVPLHPLTQLTVVEIPRYLNTSTPHPIIVPDPTVCCFAFQPTVSANYWRITSSSTRNYIAENVTSLLTYYTVFEDGSPISTRWENTTLHNVSTSTVLTWAVGQNPLFVQTNGGNRVKQTAVALNGTATITGGVSM